MTTATVKRLRTTPIDPSLARFVRGRMKDTGTPGVSVGVWHKGRAYASGFGVTSLEAPDPVDENTLFQIGSTGKTYTATAIMHLVERGDLELDVPVKRYLRDLKLKDADVTKKVTLRHLLTHTGGWAGDYFSNTGRGDDALARVVGELAKIPQLTPLGEVWHYNNAGFYIAGRVIEKVTGTSYEQAITELLLEPLGMTRSFFFAEEAIIYRVVAGHNAATPRSTKHSVAKPWDIGRNAGPAGGLISDAVDQLRWAQFHLGDGRAPGGKRLLKRSSLREMQKVQAEAGNIARSVGLSWFLDDYDGVTLVAHGGTTYGQQSAFVMAPERDFAVTVLTNSNRGMEVHEKVVKKSLAIYLGLEHRLPETLSTNGSDLGSYAGKYVDPFKQGELELTVRGHKLHTKFSLVEDPKAPSGVAPFHLVPFDEDRFLVQGGRLDGLRAEFLRDGRNRVRWIRFGGRLWGKKTAR
ncbi:MAG TPA: serine hydrolase domain-containing protein [Actinomycetota bacterium]|nr:serine hydrolase domain-containing protein [Actinomycetota bacterium]